MNAASQAMSSTAAASYSAGVEQNPKESSSKIHASRR